MTNQRSSVIMEEYRPPSPFFSFSLSLRFRCRSCSQLCRWNYSSCRTACSCSASCYLDACSPVSFITCPFSIRSSSCRLAICFILISVSVWSRCSFSSRSSPS
jgi:hypothetical protein